MRVVLMLAVAALIALAVAILTGSTWPAILVVLLAAAGIVLLLRDWRSDRSVPAQPVLKDTGESSSLRPDEFAPDISADPSGPSSDARADQF